MFEKDKLDHMYNQPVFQLKNLSDRYVPVPQP